MFYEISEVSCFKLIKKFFQLSDYCDENTSMHIHVHTCARRKTKINANLQYSQIKEQFI